MAESILDATEQQLATAQAKVTFLGTQTKPIATVTFAPEGQVVSMDRFLAVQPGGQPYSNDGLPYTEHFAVTPAEFRRVLGALKPVLTGPEAARPPLILSFTVVGDAGGGDFRIARDAARRFYLVLINSLDPENHRGRTLLHNQLAAALPGAA